MSKRLTVKDCATEISALWTAANRQALALAVESAHRGQLEKRIDALLQELECDAQPKQKPAVTVEEVEKIMLAELRRQRGTPTIRCCARVAMRLLGQGGKT